VLGEESDASIDVHGPSGQTNFAEHFDRLKPYSRLKTQAWYLLNYANAKFLMLDSQSSYAERFPQGELIRKQLKAVPEEVSFLFVVLHHPLVTHASRMPSVYHCKGRHSKPVMAHDVEDAEKLLKGLLEEFAKTHPSVRVIVLSGHNHNYERYVVNGITYVVTAGGGATPYRINRRSTDFYSEAGPTYHYCKFTISGNSLIGEM
jgi:acid phosphatase type 7